MPDITWPGATPPACLISGASGGLGRAVAESLARSGATVVLTSRDPRQASAMAAELKAAGDVRALSAGLDIARRESVDAAVRAIEALGRLDVLINNAAAYVDWGETASTADLGASLAVMDINLFGTWNMIQAFLPVLRRSPHPRIVNVASGAGSHGDARYGLTARRGARASYAVSKAALLALTAALAAELEGTPVIVNAVDPDLTATWPGAEAMDARPVSDSVPGIVWAATLPDDGPRGGFYRDGLPLPGDRATAGTPEAG